MELLRKIDTDTLKKMLNEIDNYATKCFVRAELLNRNEL